MVQREIYVTHAADVYRVLNRRFGSLRSDILQHARYSLQDGIDLILDVDVEVDN